MEKNVFLNAKKRNSFRPARWSAWNPRFSLTIAIGWGYSGKAILQVSYGSFFISGTVEIFFGQRCLCKPQTTHIIIGFSEKIRPRSCWGFLAGCTGTSSIFCRDYRDCVTLTVLQRLHGAWWTLRRADVIIAGLARQMTSWNELSGSRGVSQGDIMIIIGRRLVSRTIFVQHWCRAFTD